MNFGLAQDWQKNYNPLCVSNIKLKLKRSLTLKDQRNFIFKIGFPNFKLSVICFSGDSFRTS